MNISSEIFPTDGSNSSDHFINGTGVEIGFNTFSIVNLITILLGVPINSYVIWHIVRGTGNGLAAEFFSLNLAVCDHVLCIECLFIILSYKCDILWMVVYSLDELAMTGRPLFQCLMCVERYLAVVHPVTFLKFKPLRYRVICSVIIWLMGLGSSLFLMTSFYSYNFYSFTWFFKFLLFLSCQLFCCVTVLRALKQSGPGERGRKREENHMKRRAFYLILITTVTLVIIYAPYIVTGILYFLSQKEVSDVYPVSCISFILGGFVQPVLYLHRAGKPSCFCSFLNLLVVTIMTIIATITSFCCKLYEK